MNNSSNEISIGNIIRMLLMQTKLIILVVLGFFLVWLAYYISTDKTYRIESVIYFENPNIGPSQDLTSVLLPASGGRIENQTYLYDTRSNVLKWIASLNLNIQSDSEELVINEFKAFSSNKPTTITLKKSSDNTIETYIDGELSDKRITTGEVFSDDGFSFVLQSYPTGQDEVSFKYVPDEFLINILQEAVSVSPIQLRRNSYNFSNEGLFKINYVTNDTDYGIKLLNVANKVFIDESLKTKSKQAGLAIDFINERLKSIELILDQNKKNLRNFQENNNSINVDLETSVLLERLSDAERQLSQLEIEEAGLSSDYTQSNRLFQNFIDQKGVLKDQIAEYESQIRELPVSQQRYIDLVRDVEITEALYTDLLNKRLSYSILEATTIGNIRIIDDAYIQSLVGPTILGGFIMIMLGFFIATLVAVMRGLFFIPLSNPAELRDAGLNEQPIIGILPKITDDNENSEIAKQSLESAFVNLRLLKNDMKVIVITSPTSGNGKTTISSDLAKKISTSNKVLLMDCDLKRGDIHKKFNLNRISVSEIAELSKSTSQISKFRITDNLYVIPRVARISDSFNYIDSEKFDKALENLKQEFDYIIIDTAPLLSISETTLLLTKADIKLLIIRHGVNKISEIKQSLSNLKQVGLGFDGIFYNAFERPKGYFGFYEYYGNYEYQYYADKYLYSQYDYED